MAIPLFVITRDRVTVTKRCIEGYKKLGDVEIIIQDNNSTYPPMVEYLDKLEKEGIKVFRYKDDSEQFYDISGRVRDTILEWYRSNDSPYYIVTDPDIELENPCPEMIQYYISILKQLPRATVVGPMLRIDDLPEHFKLKEEMVQAHEVQFWGKNREPYCTMFDGIRIQYCPIDTTFGMYRKEFEFKRLNLGFRVYEPYMARHLDWYIDTDNLTEEQRYYKDNCNKVISTLSLHIDRGKMN